MEGIFILQTCRYYRIGEVLFMLQTVLSCLNLMAGTGIPILSIKKHGFYRLRLMIEGIIYAGSQNEFGFFKPDAAGKLEYYSLSDSLSIDDYDFTNVWKVHSLGGCVVFQSEEKLFLYKNGGLRIIKPETSFHTSFKVKRQAVCTRTWQGASGTEK